MSLRWRRNLEPIKEAVDIRLRDQALRWLTQREYSREELKKRLRMKLPTASESSVQALLEELAELGLQSDARFTEAYIHDRALRGYGPTRIALELKERGISAVLIANHLDTHNPVWQTRAEHVRRKKFGEAIPKTWVMQQKQAQFLYYRGFTTEQIADSENVLILKDETP